MSLTLIKAIERRLGSATIEVMMQRSQSFVFALLSFVVLQRALHESALIHGFYCLLLGSQFCSCVACQDHLSFSSRLTALAHASKRRVDSLELTNFDHLTLRERVLDSGQHCFLLRSLLFCKLEKRRINSQFLLTRNYRSVESFLALGTLARSILSAIVKP